MRVTVSLNTNVLSTVERQNGVQYKPCTCPGNAQHLFQMGSTPTGSLWWDENGDLHDETCPTHGQELEVVGTDRYPRAGRRTITR